MTNSEPAETIYQEQQETKPEGKPDTNVYINRRERTVDVVSVDVADDYSSHVDIDKKNRTITYRMY